MGSWGGHWAPPSLIHPRDREAVPYFLPRALSRLFLMASRKSVVFTKCSFSFTLGRQRGIGGGPCPPPTGTTSRMSLGCGPCPTQLAVNSHPESLGTVQSPVAACGHCAQPAPGHFPTLVAALQGQPILVVTILFLWPAHRVIPPSWSPMQPRCPGAGGCPPALP